jgi:hypothetical protein
MNTRVVLGLLLVSSVAWAKPKLTTKQTGLYPSKTCKTKIKGGEGQDPVLTCPSGAKGFAVEVFFSATDTHVTISGTGGETSINGRLGDKLEWRLADGVPYALLVELADTDQDAATSPAVNPRVAVFGIGDAKAHSEAAIVAKPKAQQAKEKQRAWTEARALADKLAPAP